MLKDLPAVPCAGPAIHRLRPQPADPNTRNVTQFLVTVPLCVDARAQPIQEQDRTASRPCGLGFATSANYAPCYAGETQSSAER
jgi:hypothetical protein